MDVAAAHLHIAEWPYVVRNGQNQQAHRKKGDEEADRREKKAAVRTVRYLLMEDVAEPRQMEQQEQYRGDDRNEDQKYPRSGDVHGSGLSGDKGAEAIILARTTHSIQC
jgi:hypothetical protein